MPLYKVKVPIVARVDVWIDAEDEEEAFNGVMENEFQLDALDQDHVYENIELQWDIKHEKGNLFFDRIEHISVSKVHDEDESDYE